MINTCHFKESFLQHCKNFVTSSTHSSRPFTMRYDGFRCSYSSDITFSSTEFGLSAKRVLETKPLQHYLINDLYRQAEILGV